MQLGLVDQEGKIHRCEQVHVNTSFHRIEYDETFSPVANMVSIHLALAIAASKGREVHQMDVKDDFLHSDLSEEIYMEKPHGFIQNSSLVCRLKKSLYGLKHAP
jgi:hypothetical protein